MVWIEVVCCDKVASGWEWQCKAREVGGGVIPSKHCLWPRLSFKVWPLKCGSVCQVWESRIIIRSPSATYHPQHPLAQMFTFQKSFLGPK